MIQLQDNADKLAQKFVCFDVIHSCQQFFSQVGTIPCILGLNQYKAEDKVCRSKTQGGSSGESRTGNPSISSPTLYQ